MAVKLYDPSLVKLTIVGIPITSGFVEDSHIEVSQANQDFTKVMGLDGQGTRLRTEDHSGSIKIRLMHTADANAALSIVRLTDVYSQNGSGVGPSMLTDLNGQTFYFAAKSWLVKPPDATLGRNAKERVWIVETDELNQFLGGANFV